MIDLVQVVQGGSGSSSDGTVLVALISGASGALVGIAAGILGYMGTIRASKNHLEAAKQAADAQLEAASRAADAQREAATRAADAHLQAAEAAARAQLAAAEQASEIQRQALRLQADLDTAKLRAAHVTAERLRWLQDLRQRLSLLYRDLDTQVDLLRRAGAHAAPDAVATQRALDELSDKVIMEVHMITLMLNPENNDQIILRRSLERIQEVVQEMFYAGGVSEQRMQEYSNLKTQSFSAMVRIGVTAWQRIQALE